MLCLSGFDLYFRWVPLNHLWTLGQSIGLGSKNRTACESIHFWMPVGECEARKAACKRTQQLPTMLGPAVHRGKDTTHKSL